jgi:hypothetical protein
VTGQSRHRYPQGEVTGDYLRGGLGFAVTAAPLVFVDLAVWVAVIFAGLALLFGLFLLRTVERQRLVVALEPEAIATAGARSRRITWGGLSDMRLAYYSTRRDRQKGWMTLTLKGEGQRLQLESSLEGFETVVETAAAAALDNGVELDPTTAANLEALGIDADRTAAEEAAAGPAQRSDWIGQLKAEQALEPRPDAPPRASPEAEPARPGAAPDEAEVAETKAAETRAADSEAGDDAGRTAGGRKGTRR